MPAIHDVRSYDEFVRFVHRPEFRTKYLGKKVVVIIDNKAGDFCRREKKHWLSHEIAPKYPEVVFLYVDNEKYYHDTQYYHKDFRSTRINKELINGEGLRWGTLCGDKVRKKLQ